MAILNYSLTTSSAKIYECPTGQENAVTTIFFCNTTGADITLTSVNLVPSGGSATDATQIMKNLVIPTADTFTFETEKVVLAQGDSIWAYATATGITTTICTLRVS